MPTVHSKDDIVEKRHHYHRKVMLFTLPQFIYSIYSSFYAAHYVHQRHQYIYHSHHVYAILISSILYWHNYTNSKWKTFFRRIDMSCVFLSGLSLLYRTRKYSDLQRDIFFFYCAGILIYFMSNKYREEYPEDCIVAHSYFHSIAHLMNIHYFLKIGDIRRNRN